MASATKRTQLRRKHKMGARGKKNKRARAKKGTRTLPMKPQ